LKSLKSRTMSKRPRFLTLRLQSKSRRTNWLMSWTWNLRSSERIMTRITIFKENMSNFKRNMTRNAFH
jgi:hypothetical protein